MINLNKMDAPVSSPQKWAIDDCIRLAFNESPYGCADSARLEIDKMMLRPNAIDSADTQFIPGINRYPDFLNVDLTLKGAKHYQAPSANIIPVAGISELIYMCLQAFVSTDRHLLMSSASYPLPAYYANEKQCGVVYVPRTEDHRIDLDACLSKADATTGLIYLSNPDNPTGSLLSFAEVERFVKAVNQKTPDTVILIDEAYMEYVEPSASAIPLTDYYPVLVGRTFSKAYGLAGLRAGFAVGQRKLVLLLNGFLGGYLGGSKGWRMFEGNVNRIATAAMVGSMNRNGLRFINAVRKDNATVKQYLSSELIRLGYNPLPSHTNFLFVSSSYDGKALQNYLWSQRILIQNGGDFHTDYAQWIRVSVGALEDIDQFLHCLSMFDPEKNYEQCPHIYYPQHSQRVSHSEGAAAL